MSLKTSLQIFISVRRFEDILKTSWRRMTKTNIFVLVTSEEVWRGEYVRYSKNKNNKIKYTAILYEYKCGGLKSVCILRKIFSKNWMRLYFLLLTASLNDDLYCNTIKSFQGTIEFVRFHRWPFVCLFLIRFHYTLWVVRLHCCCGPVHQQVFPKKTEKIPEVNFRYFLL